MRTIININRNWSFVRADVGLSGASHATAITVDLPHTWNALDGQDGGNDYYRGRCWYYRELVLPTHNPGEEVWLEFQGAAMVTDVYLNGQHLLRHTGGYSTFRVNLTPALAAAANHLAVAVDNGPARDYYPQRADFTFYGGIYRDVNLIIVPKTHFVLDRMGSSGIKVTPKITGDQALIRIEAWLTQSTDETQVRLAVDGYGSAVVNAANGYAEAELMLDQVRLWDGTADPFLYQATAELLSADSSIDQIKTRFGCRTFSIDPDRGFLLNGRPCPLCGAARHQDRRGAGSALTPAMHREDMAIMREMGANTVRLAHYQHDQIFYDLADEYGLIVWAEIPYITEHMPEARVNAASQLTELVLQNYNHPSIVCWGLSNEITTTTGVTDDILTSHRQLNERCHQLDATRPTVMAHAFMLDIDSPLIDIPDINSYNLYFGWYLGQTADNDEWFDTYRAAHPDQAIGLSEYGADALITCQAHRPERGDYSEQYQALYHEHMIGMWLQRPYIWAMHVWNMFDFAADGRDESDDPGVNHKGLVTFDRQIKKDAFYLYKAALSHEPFVHLCGSRYIDRTEPMTEIKVYSNQPEITLLVDGREVGRQTGKRVFNFTIPCTGEHQIEARCGAMSDSIRIRKVDQPNPAYSQQGADVVNWLDLDALPAPVGFYSIQDSINAISSSSEGAVFVENLIAGLRASFGDVAQSARMPEALQKKMQETPLRSMLRQAGKAVTPAMVREINQMLNTIPKTIKV